MYRGPWLRNSRTSTTFDKAGNLTEAASLKSDNSVISDFQYAFDGAGNRTSVLENTGDCVTWLYDETNQLINENSSSTNMYEHEFTYDSVGNRLVKNVDGALTTSTYDAADQFIQSVDGSGQTTIYSFDRTGNLVSVDVSGVRTTSSWDYENQRIGVALPSGQKVTYAFSADNRRTGEET